MAARGVGYFSATIWLGSVWKRLEASGSVWERLRASGSVWKRAGSEFQNWVANLSEIPFEKVVSDGAFVNFFGRPWGRVLFGDNLVWERLGANEGSGGSRKARICDTVAQNGAMKY